MFQWIRDTSLSMQTLLSARLSAEPVLATQFGPGGTSVVSLHTPEEMADIPEQGLSVWLYQVVRDEFQLNRPPVRVGHDRLRRAPLPVRLHYLLTPIASGGNGVGAPELEQYIVGKVLEIFHDQPTLRGADLVGDLAGGDVELTARLETMSLEEITRVWDAMERSYQLCLSYEVSLVPIHATRETATGAPVLRVEPELGLAAELKP